jgi:hypothetical protein
MRSRYSIVLAVATGAASMTTLISTVEAQPMRDLHVATARRSL